MKLLNRKISIRVSMAVLVTTILLVSVAVIFAGSNFTVPYTFSSGTTISSSQVNANFQAIGQQLPYSKTILFNTTNLPSTENTSVSGILAVTPPANGYLIVFGHAIVSLTPGQPMYAMVYINPCDSTGVALDSKSYQGFIGTPKTIHDISYSKGYVTANTPLYFYLGAYGTEGTIEGRLSALFIPAPNQLP